MIRNEAVREPLMCPCCASTNVVVVRIECDDCGAVTVRERTLPYARLKPDRRREPRDCRREPRD